jgi:hypothetical protein
VIAVMMRGTIVRTVPCLVADAVTGISALGCGETHFASSEISLLPASLCSDPVSVM